MMTSPQDASGRAHHKAEDAPSENEWPAEAQGNWHRLKDAAGQADAQRRNPSSGQIPHCTVP
jgi:hypothetical protein